MCPYCLHSFNASTEKASLIMCDHLKLHMDTGSQHSCAKCSLVFVQRSDLLDHHKFSHHPTVFLDLGKSE